MTKQQLYDEMYPQGDDRLNVQLLCVDCHQLKTSLEDKVMQEFQFQQVDPKLVDYETQFLPALIATSSLVWRPGRIYCLPSSRRRDTHFNIVMNFLHN